MPVTTIPLLTVSSIRVSAVAGGAAVTVPALDRTLPLGYSVQQNGKNRVDIRVMKAPGAPLCRYAPKTRSMALPARTSDRVTAGGAFGNAWLRPGRRPAPGAPIQDGSEVKP
jgi:hypothetical protein